MYKHTLAHTHFKTIKMEKQTPVTRKKFFLILNDSQNNAPNMNVQYNGNLYY